MTDRLDEIKETYDTDTPWDRPEYVMDIHYLVRRLEAAEAALDEVAIRWTKKDGVWPFDIVKAWEESR